MTFLQPALTDEFAFPSNMTVSPVSNRRVNYELFCGKRHILCTNLKYITSSRRHETGAYTLDPVWALGTLWLVPPIGKFLYPDYPIQWRYPEGGLVFNPSPPLNLMNFLDLCVCTQTQLNLCSYAH